ncbi:beta-N-acetylhexosaminidase [Rheinheimera riviphila]|uniref:beta-N-acetylhexosaminidase n=1 Tax=Rheinheimera riviphila TaxID=1834037 RepID=A0A437QMK2_9GAMM|nr:family 20 glycosylhydrolase [Rheinheimera riviphila]RVU35649.1 beta-N-acetylhexosaminidase [Rheinheimera riviphila]
MKALVLSHQTLLLCGSLLYASALLSPQLQAEPRPAAEVAAALKVEYQLLQPAYAECPVSKLRKEPGCYLSRLSLTLPFAHQATDWRIYFSQLTPVIASLHPQLQIRHLNGDLHELSAKAGFSGFQARQPIEIDFISASGIFSQSMLPGNYLLQDKYNDVHLITSTSTGNTDASGTPAFIRPFTNSNPEFLQNPADELGVASGESLYQHYLHYQRAQAAAPANTTATQHRLIPKPALQQELSKTAVNTTAGFALQLADAQLQQQLQSALLQLQQQQLLKPQSKTPLQIRIKTGFASAEHYRLRIEPAGIQIEAGGTAGAFYALQSVLGLYDAANKQLPSVLIEDGPAYPYRGQHVDIARNFLGKDFILQLISQMARYKMNQLHLHLADDEGWRIAIKALPELTELGARRCLDLGETRCLLPQLGAGHQPDALPNGFLSQQDYLDILAHAKAHQVRVIPSLDMPGHSRAAVKAMSLRAEKLKQQQSPDWDQHLLTEAVDRSDYLSIQYYHDNTINVCLDSSYRFIDTVLDELVSMHQQAGMPLGLYHIGADETAGAWQQSPACQKLKDAGETDLMRYFLTRTASLLQAKGVQLAAWSDGLKHLQPGQNSQPLPSSVTSYIWQNSYDGAALTAHQHANPGWQVVLALPDASYFDVPYLNTPYARGNHWASRMLSTEKVFSFQPQNLPSLAAVWQDLNGKNYQINDKVPLQQPKQIIGLQGNLWTEVIPDAQSAWQMLLPRLLAFAERSWHLADWQPPYQPGRSYQHNSPLLSAKQSQQYQADWHSFQQRLWFKEVPALLAAGLPVQLPWVGVKQIKGKLQALTEPGLLIEYQQGHQPWQLYQQPLPPANNIRFRSKIVNPLPPAAQTLPQHGLSSTVGTAW